MNIKPKLFTNLFDEEMFLKDVAREGLQPQYQRDAQDYFRGKKIMPDVSDITQMKLGRDARNYAVNNNQNRMQQWAGGPVKRQNKQMKNNFDFNRGSDFRESFMSPSELTNLYAGNGDPDFYDKSLSTGRKLERGRPNYTGQREIYVNRNDRATPPKNISISRLAVPIGALPMVAPEAVGMIGAAREAKQQGVNPMVNWLQRMTPVPVVAPTGNGGEVYNYQSGERYTPMY